MTIPATISAGVDFEVKVSLAARPAPTWTLTLHMRGPSAIDLTSVADGTDHRLAADAATTSGWSEGVYTWQLRAADGSDTVLIDRGETRVAPDIAQVAAGTDQRGHARTVLDAIEAVIEGRATRDQESYQINNRSLTLTPIRELMRLRHHYRAEVQTAEAAGAGRAGGRRWKVSF